MLNPLDGEAAMRSFSFSFSYLPLKFKCFFPFFFFEKRRVSFSSAVSPLSLDCWVSSWLFLTTEPKPSLRFCGGLGH